jgi:hypothetical protein
MRKYLIAAAAGVSTLALATAASATVTFDPGTGLGFVGKGDVQLVYGWNNAAAQRNIPSITFSYEKDVSYDATCTWDTVTGGKNSKIITHIVTTSHTFAVSDAVQWDARVHNQIDGIFLTGLGSETVTGSPPPNVGDSCVGGDINPNTNQPIFGQITDVEVSPDSSTVGTLFVTYNGNTQPLGQF